MSEASSALPHRRRAGEDMTNWIPLRYHLPRTVFTVRARIRFAVAYDGSGGHLEPRSDAELSAGTVADRRYRCTTTRGSDSGEPWIGTTAEGLLRTGTASGSGPGRPTVFSGGGRSTWSRDRTTQDREETVRAGWTGTGDLRAAFDRANPRISALIEDLSSLAEQFLAGIRMGEGPAEVGRFGQALTIVERELAAADRMRREWIAAQGFTLREGTWTLAVDQMTDRGEPGPAAVLPAGTPVAVGPARELAERFGILLVAHDPDRSGVGANHGELDRTDEILLRQPRPVSVAVYRRLPEDLREAGEPEPDWVLDPLLGEDLDVVDAFSPLATADARGFPATGHGPGAEPDPSPTVPVPGTPAEPILTQRGEPLPEDLPVPVADRAAVAAAAREAAGVQLALLRASDEFTQLAVTHARTGELSSLEPDLRADRPRPARD
jgi:hypothetical protein